MTKQEAKDLSIELWTWLRDHPCKGKMETPFELRMRIDTLKGRCPLCEYTEQCVIESGVKRHPFDRCLICPMGDTCAPDSSVFDTWCNAKNEGDKERCQVAAEKILARIQAW